MSTPRHPILCGPEETWTVCGKGDSAVRAWVHVDPQTGEQFVVLFSEDGELMVPRSTWRTLAEGLLAAYVEGARPERVKR